jgi:hypothetical protein
VADIRFINGEPLKAISVLKELGKNLALIMKGVAIIKNQTSD